jgi:hypothetical protein
MLAYMQTDAGKQHQQRMSRRAAEIVETSAEWRRLYAICNNASSRCRKATNYADRGIEFRFASPRAMVLWIIENLGFPATGYSIDRIDNDGHYAPGNLRWATRKQQNNNKRQYKKRVYGSRIEQLMAQTAYGYESIRTFISQGMTDAEIIAREKSKSGRPRVRHTQLRPE